MNKHPSQPFLPTLKKNFSATDHHPTITRKTTLNRIHYPPIRSSVTKENFQSMMIQSCTTNDRFEEVAEKHNELKIAKNLAPNSQASAKEIEKVATYIGKEAPIKYYQKYKSLNRTLQRRDLNKDSLNPDLNLQSPAVYLLEKSEKLGILPLCLGLVKTKGDMCVLNVSDYNLGDRYIMALAAGIKKARSLQKIYLCGNRMTDLSLADIADAVSQEITIIDLSRNKITVLDKKILEMIIEPQFRLQSLGIANNFLKVSSADAIFRNARYSKHIRRLDFRNNKLGSGCLESLSELLQKSTTLEELYIGGNYLSGKNGEKIFNSLVRNKFLRVFDYSLNQLGEDNTNATAQAISKCLESNKALEHLDLSFNNFTKQASEIIGNGLEPNKTLYGIHFRGNYGFINARGFLVIAERQGTVLHSVDTFKMDSFEITCPREQNALDSHMYRDVCWICEGWYEQQFKMTFPKQEGIMVYIHFDFQKYEPRLISITETVKYVTMVPPKKFRYFFTVNNETCFDPNHEKQTLPFSETHTYEVNNESRTFKITEVNWRRGKQKKIVNAWNEVIIKTLPRCNGLMIKKEKEPWDFDKSVWAKEMKLQTEQLLRKCFEKDWKCSKITNLVKAQADQDKVKDLLWKNYIHIKYLYKFYSSWNPFGDVWAVSSNPFTQFCQQAKIINKETPLKIIDLTFITTNSISGASYKGNSLVPERGLVRFQFMEVLVRLAEEKFKKLGITDNFADSLKLLLEQNVIPLAKSYHFQTWRQKQYFNEFNDSLIRKYRAIFSTVYKKNSKVKVKPGQKPFMCISEFKNICDRIGLGTQLNERDIFIAFNNGMMTHVDQIQTEKYMKMTEIQFIQGLARCASGLSSTYTVEPTPTPSLHLKLEWIAQQLRLICPEETRQQLPQIETTMFREEQEE